MPEASFRVILDGGPEAITEPWKPVVPPNIHITGRLSTQEELRELMAQARAIINTSPLEGFPNLMLQGAMTGCPALFLCVDPDGWAGTHGCAATASGDFDAFAALLARARRDQPWLDGMARRAQDRALTLHAPDVIRDAVVETLAAAAPMVGGR